MKGRHEMSETKHTPGPWYVDDVDWLAISPFGVFIRLQTRFDDTDIPISSPACDAQYEVTQAEQRANARLIAAAPDLLATSIQANRDLRDIREKLDMEQWTKPEILQALVSVGDRLGVAITKARP
jgi:hypothetical protein